jgi:hypothetical protein
MRLPKFTAETSLYNRSSEGYTGDSTKVSFTGGGAVTPQCILETCVCSEYGCHCRWNCNGFVSIQ